MMQYKSPGGCMWPIPANYREKDRKPYLSNEQTICPCDEKTFINVKCDKFEESLFRRLTDVGNESFCLYWIKGMCNLSRVDEIDMVHATSYEMLPLLIGEVQTELGKQELEKRLKS